MGVSSGSFETSAYSAAGSQYPNRIRVEWESSQDVATNSSTINWIVKSVGGIDGKFVFARKLTVNIGGINVLRKLDDFKMWANDTLGSGSFKLTHDQSGNATLNAGAEVAIYTFDINSTKYGYSVALPQIPRASSISVSGNTMGSPITILISKADPSFTNTIDFRFGNRRYPLAQQTTSVSLLWTPPLECADQITYGTSGTGTMSCITYDRNNVKVGETSINVTLNVPAYVKPSIKSFLPSIASTKPDRCGMYVKNHSTVQWDANVEGIYGSVIRKCVIDGPNLHYESTHINTKYTAKSSTLTTYGNNSYTITITDSRGRTASMTKSINVVDYNPPVITSANSFRSDQDGNMDISGMYVTHKINLSFYTLNGKNRIKIVAYSKEGASETYGNGDIIKDDANNQTQYTYTMTQTFDVSKTYDFKFIISDTVGGSHTVYTHVGTKNVPLNIAGNNKSVAIGGFAQNSSTGRFDCEWKAHFATAPITSSDRNLKYNIADISIDVIDKLRPVQYNLINESSVITHYGFIAQDVEQALKESGATNNKNGIVYYDENVETKERSNYALAYDELIPLLVKKCQELQLEVNRLKGE